MQGVHGGTSARCLSGQKRAFQKKDAGPETAQIIAIFLHKEAILPL